MLKMEVFHHVCVSVFAHCGILWKAPLYQMRPGGFTLDSY